MPRSHRFSACPNTVTMILRGMSFTRLFPGRRRTGKVETGIATVLVVLGGFALAGPAGLLAWSENLSLRDERQAELAELRAERDALRNRVALLDPDGVDPDMAGELIRGQLNVVAPGEVIVRFDED